MVQSWDYEIKKKSRKVILDFARRHMPRYAPEDIRMLCLAGIDCADVYEISRPLRIPDQQITIVERDPQVFAQIEKQKIQGKIGCNLYFGELKDFLEKTDETFRFISLDYTGQLTPQRTEEIDTVFDRHLLAPHSILHTNFYGKMERQFVQEAYKNIAYGRYGNPFSEENQGTVKDIVARVEQTPLPKLRDEVITEMLIIDALNGSSNIPESLLRVTPFDTVYKEISDYVDQDYPPGTFANPRAITRVKSIIFRYEVIDMLRKSLLDSVLINYAIYNALIQPYFAIYFERYNYFGPKGAHMYTDLIEFDQREKIMSSNPIRFEWDETDNLFFLRGDIPVKNASGGWKFRDPRNHLNFQNFLHLPHYGLRFFDENHNPRFKEREIIE